MVNSINTNIAAYSAQGNLSRASNDVADNVARLSSGNRIVRAAQDVAGLSIGTILRTSVSTLRVALTNASQGQSMLQIADGALSQITEILQRQKAIALQASSGSLDASARGFLNQEFQALQAEIDRLSGSTNFNGVKLINGSLSSSSTVAASTNNASAASLNLTLNQNVAAGETIVFRVGNATFTLTGRANAGALTAATSTSADFVVGASIQETIDNIAAVLNSFAAAGATDGVPATSTTISAAQFESNGTTLVISARSGGSLSNSFSVDVTTGTATRAGRATVATEGNTGYGDESHFNLFTTASATWTSATAIVSAVTAAAGTPFQEGNTITAKLENGETKTLLSLTTAGGTGANGRYTLKDIVDGINNNTGVTGFKAALVYSGGTYNIRVSYKGTASNIVLNAGANFDSTTYALNGQFLTSAGVTTTGGAATGTALIYSNYIDVLNATGLTNSTSTTVTATSGGLSTTTPFTVGAALSIEFNGVMTQLHEFAAGDGLDDILADINAHTKDTGVYAVIVGGGTYNLRLYFTDPDGTFGNDAAGANHVGISMGAAGSGTSVINSAATTAVTTGFGVNTVSASSLGGGLDDGLGQGGTTVTGSVGDDILTSLSQARANSSLIFTANASAGDTITIGGKVFTFTANTVRGADEILISSLTDSTAAIRETIDNAISTIKSYVKNNTVNGEGYFLNQINFTRSGSSLVLTGKGLGNVYNIAGTATTVAASSSNVSVTAGTLNNAASTVGIDATGITNSAFTGALQGFTATYRSADTADLIIKVGKYTYTAKAVDLTVSSNTKVRFISDTVDGASGGYFDLQLQANKVTSVSSQADADAVASRLNVAFSSLNFLQQRGLSNYHGTQGIVSGGSVIGSLVGTTVSAQFADYTNLRLSDILVTAPSGSATDAKITLVINGVNYSTGAGIGTKLGANQTYRLVSEDDPNQFVDFTTGNSTITIDTSDKAAAVRTALKEAFGATEGSAALSFQVGSTSADTLEISIGDATTNSLYGGATLDVLNQANAAAASLTLDSALATITSLRAGVGAAQSRFLFATASIENGIQNQEAARSVLLDTDVAVESTAYAGNQVRVQAGISVLAQANQQLQALLKLIG